MNLGQFDAVRVYADIVDIEYVDAVQAEPRMAKIHRAHDAIIAVVILQLERQRIDKAELWNLVFRHWFQESPDLGGQHIAVARPAGKKIAKATFGKTETVERGGIEKAY